MNDRSNAQQDAQTARLEAAMEQLRIRRDQRDRARRERRERQRVVNLRPLDVTHTFKDRRREIQALCDYLAEERVRLVTVVGRGGMGKTALACRVLGELEETIRPAAPEETALPDLYAAYEAGLDHLLARLGNEHPRYSEALTFQSRLLENIGQSRRHGDTETRRAERSQIVTALNELALTTLGQSFIDLCGPLAIDGEQQASAGLDGILYLSARSTGLGLERIHTDVGRMLGEEGARRLSTYWAGEAPLTAKVEYLLESLRDGTYLLLLDNLEDHLSPEGKIEDEGLRLFVERCLGLPGGAQLIITSREQVKVPPAGLAGARRIFLREGLPEEEAVALLRELDPQGDLGLRDATEEDLQRAARLTRRIPRALEILTGILREDPGTNLGDLLADEALFGEQVVEQLVEESYHRLGQRERRIMEALAVFDCPVEATAVSFLLHPWFPKMDVPAGLRRLVRSHFAGVSRATGEYNLHPLDREHAYRQLPDSDTSESYCRRNLELRAAEFYARMRKPEKEWRSIEDLAPQLAEFEHRVRAGDYEEACQVLEQIDFWNLRLWGHYTRLVEMRKKLQGHLVSLRLQSANLGGLGSAYNALGQIRKAIEFHSRSIEAARQANDRWRQGVSLGCLGSDYRVLGQFDQALEYYREALTIAREVGDRRNEGAWLGNLGRIHRNLGEINRAIELYKEALNITREVGDRWGEGDRLGLLGNAYLALGQVERAITLHKQAVTIAREVGNRRREGDWLASLGSAYQDLGEVELAISMYNDALTIAHDIGDYRGKSNRLALLAESYYSLGHTQQALDSYEQALAITDEIGHRQGSSYCLLGLSRAHLVTGRYSRVQESCQQVLSLGMALTSSQAALVLGICLLRQGKTTSGKAFYDARNRCRVLLSKTPQLVRARYTLAAALVGQAICNPRWAEESARPELLVNFRPSWVHRFSAKAVHS